MAYYRLEPFGERRSDYRAGVIASAFQNMFRKKTAKPITPDKFMPTFGAQQPANVAEKIKKTFRNMKGYQKI